jgi:hypothetical protein
MRGVGQIATSAFRPTPLIRLGASRQSTFSHKGEKEEARFIIATPGFHRLAIVKERSSFARR